MAIRRAEPYPLIKTGNSDSFPSGPTGFSKSKALPPSADFDSRSAAAAISNSVLAGSRIRSSSLSFSSLLTHSVEESYAMEPRILPHFPLQTSSPSAYPFIPISSPISYIQYSARHIQSMLSQISQLHMLQSRFVRRLQHHQRRLAGESRLFPASRTDTPPIPRP